MALHTNRVVTSGPLGKKVAHPWNIQSVTSKTLEIRELIAEKPLDILALTETWLSNNDC